MYLHYGQVINCVQAKTKYGPRLALNVKLEDGEKVACWSDVLDNASFLSKKPGDKVSLIKGVRGSYSLVEQEQPRNVNGNGLKPINEVLAGNTIPNQTYSQPASNGSNTPVNHQEVIEDIIHDVPILSDLDKKKVARFIDQQARLYRYTVDTVAKQFPELVGVDDRGIRSIALSLLINTNHMINRNL